MRRTLILVFVGIAVLATGLVYSGAPGSTASANAEVFHVTQTHAVVPGLDVDRCDGHAVSLTLFINGPIHSTTTPSGNSNFLVANTGTFVAESLDPAFADEEGRFTVHVTDNANSAGANFVFTFRVKGRSVNGEPLSWNQTARVFVDADGELQVLFDNVVNCS